MTTTSPESDRGVDFDALRGRDPDVNDVGTRPGASDTDVVTGPMPVVDLVGGHLHVSVRRGVTIVAVDGGLDDALAAVLAPAIDAAVGGSNAVVLDLDQVTLLDRSALDTVCAAIDGERDISRCIVAPRLSSRLVLERWDIPKTFAVFGSVPDALQARTFVESGYGDGWTAASS